MSWVPEKEYSYSWLEWFLLRVLRTGAVPRHVAFIMDGNRRFAKKNQIEKIEGHSRGFETLAKVLQWSRDIGIEEVTVYAFSIENFKRPQAEVDGILDLAQEKFKSLIAEQDRLREHGVRVKVIGNVHLLPTELQSLIAEAESVTRDNKQRTLNIAFSYTSREEMAKAMQTTARGVSSGLLLPSDIDEHLLERCLYTEMSSQVDLLVRTSGEVRLSDFLLWQSSFSVIHFSEVLWPEYSVVNLCAAIFYYQRHRRGIEEAHQWAPVGKSLRGDNGSDGESSGDSSEGEGEGKEARIGKFLRTLESKKLSSEAALMAKKSSSEL